MTRARLIDGFAATCVIAVVGVCALRPIWNSDIWWHIVVGDWIRATGHLPSADVWSAHEGGTWTSFSWLYQWFIAGVHQTLGLDGIRGLSALLLCATFALFYAFCRRSGASVGHALLLTFALLVAYHYRFRVRPHIVNLLAFTTVVFYLRWAVPRWWHALFALVAFATWAALHAGGALLGAAAVVVSLLGAALWARGDELRDVRVRFFAVGLAALVGWIIVPGSLRTVMVVAGDQGQTIADVAEWTNYPAMFSRLATPAPGGFRVHLAATLLLWPCALAAWALAWRRRSTAGGDDSGSGERGAHRVRVTISLAVAAYFLAAAVVWFRFYYLAIMAVALLPLAPSARTAAGLGARFSRGVAGLTLATIALVFSTVAQFGGVSDGIAALGQTYDERYYPTAEAELLGLSGIEARVATIAAWGGFVLYHGRYTPPTPEHRLRVTTDGRNAAPAEVVVLQQAIEAAIRTCRGMAELPAMYAALPADILLMPAPNPACAGMPDNALWIRVSQSPRAELYLRRGPETGAWIEALSRVIAERR